MGDAEAGKRAAALRALDEVRSGMVVGLGSGTTAEMFVEALGERMKREKMALTGVPTSERTRILAAKLGIPTVPPGKAPHIDVDIDGADQVERGTLALIKGLGGALLREKIVASAAKRMVVIVDHGKLVDRLGAKTPLPVEIVAFGSQDVVARLAAKGWAPTLRAVGAKPFTTDGGNHIADCLIPDISNASALEKELMAVEGVIDTGLFLGLATTVLVGGPAGVEVLKKTGGAAS